jgi:hypothetical protein
MGIQDLVWGQEEGEIEPGTENLEKRRVSQVGVEGDGVEKVERKGDSNCREGTRANRLRGERRRNHRVWKGLAVE